MKSNMFLAAIVAVIFAISCSKKYEPKDKVEQAFMEYVESDFADPESFVEIAKIERRDTAQTAFMMDMLCKVDSFMWAMPEPIVKRQERLKDKIAKSDIFIVEHELKVRVKDGEDKMKMETYYVVEDHGKIHVQDHSFNEEEMPSELVEYIDHIDEVLAEHDKVLKMLRGY